MTTTTDTKMQAAVRKIQDELHDIAANVRSAAHALDDLLDGSTDTESVTSDDEYRRRYLMQIRKELLADVKAFEQEFLAAINDAVQN